MFLRRSLLLGATALAMVQSAAAQDVQRPLSIQTNAGSTMQISPGVGTQPGLIMGFQNALLPQIQRGAFSGGTPIQDRQSTIGISVGGGLSFGGVGGLNLRNVPVDDNAALFSLPITPPQPAAGTGQEEEAGSSAQREISAQLQAIQTANGGPSPNGVRNMIEGGAPAVTVELPQVGDGQYITKQAQMFAPGSGSTPGLTPPSGIEIVAGTTPSPLGASSSPQTLVSTPMPDFGYRVIPSDQGVPPQQLSFQSGIPLAPAGSTMLVIDHTPAPETSIKLENIDFASVIGAQRAVTEPPISVNGSMQNIVTGGAPNPNGTLSQGNNSQPPAGTGVPPGLYVHVLDGMIQLSNTGGSQHFAAGQFGYTGGFIQPPVILPANPGITFSPPPSFSSRPPDAIGTGIGLGYDTAPGGFPSFVTQSGLGGSLTSGNTGNGLGSFGIGGSFQSAGGYGAGQTPTPPPSSGNPTPGELVRDTFFEEVTPRQDLAGLITVERTISDIDVEFARQVEGLRQIVAQDPQAMISAIGPAMERLKDLAGSSPDGMAAFPEMAATFFSMASAAIESWVPAEEMKVALHVALAQAVQGEISQLGGQLSPEIIAEALINAAQTLTDFAATSLTSPNASIAAALTGIATAIPDGVRPDAVAAIKEIADAVSSGDFDKLENASVGGPVSASKS